MKYSLVGKQDDHSLRKKREITMLYSKGMTRFQLAVKYGIDINEITEITRGCKRIKAKP